ncbi:MAG: Hsp20/alpha crystallin family protein [Staphylothermus sp.]|nr:Hsp20/alpha crystallin family protein [Staphylothermus sp.]
MSFDELFEKMRKRIKELIDEFEEEIRELEPMWTADGVLEPLVSIGRYPDKYVVVIDLPYADFDTLSLSIKDHLLIIECALKREIMFERWGAYREIKFKRYHTAIRLPLDVDVENIRIEKDTARRMLRLIIPRIRIE